MGITSPYRDYVDGMQSKKAKLSYLTSNGFDYYLVSKYSAHWYESNLSLKVVNATDTLVLLENAG